MILATPFIFGCSFIVSIPAAVTSEMNVWYKFSWMYLIHYNIRHFTGARSDLYLTPTKMFRLIH